MKENNFLRTKNGRIIGREGKAVFLRGANLGGWLMMEAYFMHSPNLPERKFKKEFKESLGAEALKDFEKSFRDNFIRELDIKKLKEMGFNCLRVPFNYRLIEGSFKNWNEEGLKYLDNAVRWAQKYGIWVILDLHAAPGCQNHDWHCDSYGKAELWTEKKHQTHTFAIWEFLADRYKNYACIAGYDLLNETVVKDAGKLDRFYKELIKVIRSVDKNHILFIEGNRWAMDVDVLSEYKDDNYALSIHHYIPLEFTFNFVPHMTYPLKAKKGGWDKKASRKYLIKYKEISQKRKVPVFVGEFGVNYREGKYNEHGWLKDTLGCFEDFGFHWTYWTYKAVKNNAFPDGILSYYENPPWVNRAGPVMGWDTYKLHWKKYKKDMIRSWKTESFRENKHVLEVLKEYAK